MRRCGGGGGIEGRSRGNSVCLFNLAKYQVLGGFRKEHMVSAISPQLSKTLDSFLVPGVCHGLNAKAFAKDSTCSEVMKLCIGKTEVERSGRRIQLITYEGGKHKALCSKG